MAKKHRIKLIGSIDESMFERFCDELDVFESKGVKKVGILLTSGGGVAYDALAIYSRMRQSPCEFVISAYGLVASAAVIILAAGNHRRIAREAWVMVHEDLISKMTCRVTQAENHITHCRNMENQWNELLTMKTTTSPHKWGQLHREERYLSPVECKKLGLVDEVF